jgi:hypothetical protein
MRYNPVGRREKRKVREGKGGGEGENEICCLTYEG